MKNILIVQPCFTFLFPSQKTGMIGQVVIKSECWGWLPITRVRAHSRCSHQDSATPGTEWQKQQQWSCSSGNNFLSLVHGVGECWLLEPQAQTVLFLLCPLITASLISLTSPGLDHYKIWVYVGFCLWLYLKNMIYTFITGSNNLQNNFLFYIAYNFYFEVSFLSSGRKLMSVCLGMHWRYF